MGYGGGGRGRERRTCGGERAKRDRGRKSVGSERVGRGVREGTREKVENERM